jgi:hypothetical protein
MRGGALPSSTLTTFSDTVTFSGGSGEQNEVKEKYGERWKNAKR